MAITEEQYDEISDELDAHDFFLIGDIAVTASNANLLQELDNLHSLAKRALEYSYDEATHDKLEIFQEEVEQVRCGVTDSIEALEKFDDLTKSWGKS
ncbi:MAG: hypothetical protein ACR2P1_02780 [Pseudomonadales bacterium]